ncbi:unnamed protein product [Moneuplotes crassus]|uniref:CENP-V/GFA domain-containing protein n=1 Tax=Euplotes crassus TaxID=5936 RepID=A0AAD1Y2A7_EUPCR|nr:unnamed protein product [Moneuplotes crassus]
MESETVVGTASCHCEKVQIEFTAPKNVAVFKCNCSICLMRQNHHFVLPQEKVKLLEDSEDYLTTYTFNTKVAKHKFCKVCGVQCFYQPRSNPDGYAITIYCVKDYEQLFESITWNEFDGQEWEQQMETSDISKYSKT